MKNEYDAYKALKKESELTFKERLERMIKEEPVSVNKVRK